MFVLIVVSVVVIVIVVSVVVVVVVVVVCLVACLFVGLFVVLLFAAVCCWFVVCVIVNGILDVCYKQSVSATRDVTIEWEEHQTTIEPTTKQQQTTLFDCFYNG